MVPFIFIGTIILLTVILFVYGSWSIWISKFSYLHRPATIPWLGATLAFSFDPHIFFMQVLGWAEKYNHLYVLWIGPSPLIVTSRVEYAEAILGSQTLTKKSSFYCFLHEWLGTGLLTSYGEKWRNRRRVITPTFHFAILNEFVSIFEEQAKKLIHKLKPIADGGESIDIQVPVSLAKLNVISETSMGVKINAQDSSSEYIDAIISMNSNIQLRQRSPWLWPKFLFQLTSNGKEYYKNLNILHNFTINAINKSIVRRQMEGTSNNEDGLAPKKRKVFLDMLLDLYDKGEIDIEGIREEVDTFMFEGHDTTATGLCWTLYELGKHPDIQDRLYEEIKTADPDLPIVDKVKSIKYLEYCIKEGLRLHPPVPMYARVTEEDTVIDNNVIPKGTDVGVFAYALHRNPMYWDNPNSYQPGRFGDEVFLKRNPYIYVPFSAGSRNCIGQKFALLEEKIFLYHLMSNYKVNSVQNEEDIKTCIEIIHKSDNGLFLEFQPR